VGPGAEPKLDGVRGSHALLEQRAGTFCARIRCCRSRCWATRMTAWPAAWVAFNAW